MTRAASRPATRARRLRPLQDERGSVMAVALVLMSLALLMGTAVMATVNTQQRESSNVRVRESSINLAEGVLETQAFALASTWSQKSTQTFAACTSSAPVQLNSCPNKASLASTYSAGDYGGAVWRSDVFDNSSTDGGNAMQSFYSDALAVNAPRYDFNRDDQMWVKSTATVRGKTRSIVALVKRQNQKEPFPTKAVIANKLRVTNEGGGSDATVDLTDPYTGTQSGLYLRCSDDPNQCLDANLRKGQVSGSVYGDRNLPPAMDGAALGRMRATAKANGAYYESCPTDLPTDQRVIFIETCDGRAYNGNATYNSKDAPGIVVVARGAISFGPGTVTFFGVVYAANLDKSSGTLVTVHGNSRVIGQVIVDGAGGVEVGSSHKGNITYLANGTDGVRSYGTTGVVQNPWREIR